MNEKAIQIVNEVKEKLLRDFPEFLELEGKERYFLGGKIDSYCTDALNDLKGNFGTSEEFANFINILYGCKQLDDFGESWAPTKEKVESWLEFLENFNP